MTIFLQIELVLYRIYLLFIFELDLWVTVTWLIATNPLHHVSYAPAKFKVAMSNSLGGNAITSKYIILTFDLGIKVTWNVAQYPLHHVTYAATIVEVATPNNLGGDAFTK